MPLSHLPHSTPHSLFAPPILDVMCELYILRTSLSCVLQVDCIRRVQKLAKEKASDQEIAAHPSLRGLKLSAAQVSIMRSFHIFLLDTPSHSLRMCRGFSDVQLAYHFYYVCHAARTGVPLVDHTGPMTPGGKRRYIDLVGTPTGAVAKPLGN